MKNILKYVSDPEHYALQKHQDLVWDSRFLNPHNMQGLPHTFWYGISWEHRYIDILLGTSLMQWNTQYQACFTSYIS